MRTDDRAIVRTACWADMVMMPKRSGKVFAREASSLFCEVQHRTRQWARSTAMGGGRDVRLAESVPAVARLLIHPELYGASPEKEIEWARHPRTMKRTQETGARQLAAAQKQKVPRN
jgi:hypothetical protein